MKNTILNTLLIFFFVIGGQAFENKANSPSIIAVITKDCSFKGKKLYGAVQFVNSNADIKIQYVDNFADIDVQMVSSNANTCGKWQEVSSGATLKVQVVNSFPDLKVKLVNSNPGMK